MTGQMSQLDLSKNRLVRIEGLVQLGTLRILNLSCNSISKIEGLSGCPQLEYLNLAENDLTAVEGLNLNTKLHTLILADNNICSVGSLARNRVLKFLDLSSNLLRSIADLSSHLPSSVEVLRLNHNEIENFHDLKGLAPLSHLRELDTSNNPLNATVASLRLVPCLLPRHSLSFSIFHTQSYARTWRTDAH